MPLGPMLLTLAPDTGCTVSWGKDLCHLELLGWPKSWGTVVEPAVTHLLSFGLSIYCSCYLLWCMLFESFCAAYCCYSMKSNGLLDDVKIWLPVRKKKSLEWIEGTACDEISPQMWDVDESDTSCPCRNAILCA